MISSGAMPQCGSAARPCQLALMDAKSSNNSSGFVLASRKASQESSSGRRRSWLSSRMGVILGCWSCPAWCYGACPKPIGRVVCEQCAQCFQVAALRGRPNASSRLIASGSVIAVAWSRGRSWSTQCKNAAGDPDDFEDSIAGKVMFDAKDNASDETLCSQTAKAVFKHMIDVGDTTHTMQLIIKHATAGEPEVKLVEEVLLTNKKPHKSVSGLLRDSSAARSSFTEEQEKQAEAVLRNLSWSPQRMSSRHKPYGRASLRPTRAEHGGDVVDKAAALHNLKTLAPFRRMVLAGMMADVTWEHRKAVMWSDGRDPDPSHIVDQLDGFLHRIRVGAYLL